MVATGLFALLLILVTLFVALARGRFNPEKIDPAFKATLNLSTKRQANPRAVIPPQFIIQQTEGFARNSLLAEQRYNCIVYTSNVAALRDSGITVNTAVGNFATAWVTSGQIQQMSLMSSARYIEAQRQLGLHNDIAVGGSAGSER